MTTEARIAEIVADFQTLVNYTDEEITSVYSFGEPDFDPTSASENAAQNLVARLMKLNGLDYDESVEWLHSQVTFA